VAGSVAGAAEGAESMVAEESEDRGEGGGLLADAQRFAADLCSSARQAAHANARLGHAMAVEREKLKGALALSQKHLSYLSAEVHTNLVFIAHPEHGPRGGGGGSAFAALMLPTLRGGLPSHWLSDESVNSLRRWCDEESMPLSALKCVVGRVVHVEGPIEVHPPGEGGADGPVANPYNLPAGERYYVVHAEMKLQHRWTV